MTRRFFTDEEIKKWLVDTGKIDPVAADLLLPTFKAFQHSLIAGEFPATR